MVFTLSTINIGKHTLCGYLLFTHCLFDGNRNRLDYYRGEVCIKKNMTGFVILGPKTHSFLIDDYTEEKS